MMEKTLIRLLKNKRRTYRLAMVFSVLTCLLLFWINGAVGIIGSVRQSINLLFFLIPIIFLGGGLLVKFRARPFANILIFIAIYQLLIPIIGLVFWSKDTLTWSPSVLGVFFLCLFFTISFCVCAFLFKFSERIEKL